MSHPERSRSTVTARFGISLPTAIGALLFAGAIVFGSSMLGPATEPNTDDTAAYSEPTDDFHQATTDQTDASDWSEDGKEPPHDTPDKTPKPEPTPKPTEKEQPKATAKPQADAGTLALEVMTFDGKVKLAWSRYNGDGFSYYKVVRSADAAVNWPPDEDDTMIAAASIPDETWTKEYPPCGKEWHYRVFAVHKSEAGYTILASSAVKAVSVACVEKPTPPDPVAMGFEVTVVEGQVHLSWDMCTSDAFGAYKVVRSQTNPEPKYPLNDGTELIAAIGDQSVSGYTDAAVAAGQTWTYRVQCMGSGPDGWYLLGLTPAVTVTVPG
jgi:hypothetical protein